MAVIRIVIIGVALVGIVPTEGFPGDVLEGKLDAGAKFVTLELPPLRP